MKQVCPHCHWLFSIPSPKALNANVCSVIGADPKAPSPFPSPLTLLKNHEDILLKAEVLLCRAWGGSEGMAPPSVGTDGVSAVRRRRRMLDWGPDEEGCLEGARWRRERH